MRYIGTLLRQEKRENIALLLCKITFYLPPNLYIHTGSSPKSVYIESTPSQGNAKSNATKTLPKKNFQGALLNPQQR